MTGGDGLFKAGIALRSPNDEFMTEGQVSGPMDKAL
jgi:hypothetical protein